MKTKSYAILFLWKTILLAHSQGTLIYDQESGNDAQVLGDKFYTLSETLQQPFVPSLSSVGFIDLALSGSDIAETVSVEILTKPSGGTILGSTEPIVMPADFGIGNTPTAPWGITNFVFSTPVTVTPGTTYYLQPVVQPGDYGYALAYQLNYPGGNMLVNGLNSGPGNDLWFQEGTFATPEPSTISLSFLIGGVLTCFGSFRKGRPEKRPQL